MFDKHPAPLDIERAVTLFILMFLFSEEPRERSGPLNELFRSFALIGSDPFPVSFRSRAEPLGSLT